MDNTSGSGTLGEACINTGREFIMIEKDLTDFKKGERRIQKSFDKIGLTITENMYKILKKEIESGEEF